jgi:hypothetical protein
MLFSSTTLACLFVTLLLLVLSPVPGADATRTRAFQNVISALDDAKVPQPLVRYRKPVIASQVSLSALCASSFAFLFKQYHLQRPV